MIKLIKKDTKDTNESKGLKTFEGVYTPTLLTILGVILYLRMGWVVGNAGLIGTVIIVLMAHVITLATALSMASMLTNIKIGAGGAYAIITRSLGHEMGGAIGIPLYLSQTLSIAFYITGFSELWVSFFPSHPQVVIGVITWVILTGISLKSAKLAFRLQYGILIAVILSILSFMFGPNLNSGGIVLTGSYGQAGFWATFAIFFPAVTGVLTGATMSGELENPRKSIIRGTLGAIVTGLAVYLFVAYWFAHQASQDMLLNDPSVIFKLAGVKIFVIAGVMGAVLSSALSTLVSAPRTLAALAEDRIIPFSSFFAKTNKGGEPIYAIILSAGISVVVLAAGNLNSLAELLTMFFLTTYGMINVVVFIEQITGVVSYRPSFKMNIFVPIVGSLGCLAVMFLINPLFTIVTFLTISTLYVFLKRKNLTSPWGDVRGGVFISIAEWAAQKAASIPNHPRLWKPSVVIPMEKAENFKRVSKIIQNLVYPSGRVYYLTATEEREMDTVEKKEIKEVLTTIREEDVYVQETIITGSGFESVLYPALQCMSSSFLSPNIVFFTLSDEDDRRKRLFSIIDSMYGLKMSYCFLWIHPKHGLGMERKINLWLRDQSPNNDLTVLCALQLSKNMGAELNLCRVLKSDEEKKEAVKSMVTFIEDARLPANTKIRVFSGEFMDHYIESSADLSIIGMPLNRKVVTELTEISPTSILFVSSSGFENALL